MARLILMRLERRVDTQVVAVASDRMIPPLRVVTTSPLVSHFLITRTIVRYGCFPNGLSIVQSLRKQPYTSEQSSSSLLTQFFLLAHGGQRKDGEPDRRVKGNN
jgi:hypothetical protein